jgi:competence ComEA-like helix-hairpin-helix protein
MHEAETRALRQAVALLVVISLVRWGWSTRDRAAATVDESVLPELLEASREAARVETRRAEALGPEERVDPNRADEVELDRLPGIGPSTARAIVAARDAGAVFAAPEDLLTVSGIGAASLARIRDRLDLSSPPRKRTRQGALDRRPAQQSTVDLNRADLDALQTLPGIGPAIAERILVTRREQPFTSIEDLTRVRGIGPATVERLRSLATAGP